MKIDAKNRSNRLRKKLRVDEYQELGFDLVWRKPEEFKDFLLACTADAKGRKGLEQKAYPQANFLLAAAQAANKVSAKPFIEQGKQGKAIREAMDIEKLNVIKGVKEAFLQIDR